jgi:hypothetical protein
MGKRRKQRRREGLAGWGDATYWQTGGYQRRLYRIYLNQIEELALNRFRWVGLPSGCDERYLEWCLLHFGMATIAQPPGRPGAWRSLQCNPSRAWGMYGMPTGWTCVGDNGVSFPANWKSGVMLYDNRTRYPLMDTLGMHARELVDIKHTKQINRMHQKIPFVIEGAQEGQIELVDFSAQIAAGEPIIVANKGLTDNIKTSVVNHDIDFIGEELTAEELNEWNLIYKALGIENLTYKAERQVQDELEAQTEPTQVTRMGWLNCRREACDKLNSRFGLDIHVYWRDDFESKTYNFERDETAQAKEGGANE